MFSILRREYTIGGTGHFSADVEDRLVADAVHALTDLISDITTLATISYSLRPATARFPLGFGKIESLGALGVSGLLLSGGIMIGLQAVMALAQQFFPEIADFLSHIGIFEHGHSHGSHAGTDLGPNINAAWLAGGSILIKEWLYRATDKVAKQKRSSVLASNAYHHRVDSLTAFVALLTITASHFLHNAQWLDPVGGLIISGMIVQAGWYNTRSALYELADVAMDSDMKENIQATAAKALMELEEPGVQISGVQGIKSGQNFMVDLEVQVPRDWSLGKTEEVEKSLREKIAASVRGVRRVAVRFVSSGKDSAAFEDEFVAGRLSDSEDDGHEHDHDHEHHDHVHRNGHATVPAQQANGSVRKRT